MCVVEQKQALSSDLGNYGESGTLPSKVSLLEVDLLWGDCTFIPADWGS